MYDELIGALVTVGAVLATGVYVFLRGKASAKKVSGLQEAKQRAHVAEKREAQVRRVAEVVADTRNVVTVTPGAAGNDVAASVRQAVLDAPKSTQGRLGAMARDR